MKKRILFTTILGILGALILLGGQYLYRYMARHMQTPISMMIATDMHYLSPEYRGEYFKSPSSIFDGKVVHYSHELCDAFFSEVLEKKPEILILSGDLTLNGSKTSHTEFVEKLENIQNAGITVLVIPGNHDVDSVSGDYTPEEPVVVESLTSDDFIKMYENFGPAQAISRDQTTFSYIYEATPYLRILMLDTNCYGKGFIKDETLAWLEVELREAKEAGIDVIAVSHQNLYAHNELLSFGYQFYNTDELLPLFEKYDVICNFSGHIHVQSIVNENIPEISTASLAVTDNLYGKIIYDGSTIQYSVQATDVETYAINNNIENEDLLNFSTFSPWYFEEVARKQVYEAYAESELSQEQIYLLAETFAQINSAYFSGEQLNTTPLSDGIGLWQEQSGFIKTYINTMIEEMKTDNQNLTIDLE